MLFCVFLVSIIRTSFDNCCLPLLIARSATAVSTESSQEVDRLGMRPCTNTDCIQELYSISPKLKTAKLLSSKCRRMRWLVWLQEICLTINRQECLDGSGPEACLCLGGRSGPLPSKDCCLTTTVSVALVSMVSTTDGFQNCFAINLGMAAACAMVQVCAPGEASSDALDPPEKTKSFVAKESMSAVSFFLS